MTFPRAPARTLHLALRLGLVLGLGLALAPLAAAGDVTLRVTAHDDGEPAAHNERAQWFEVDGYAGRDPTLRLAPGDTVHVTFTNEGTHAHSFDTSFGAGTPLLAPNATATLDLTVPGDTTSGAYWCDAHRVIGMAGAIDLGHGVSAANVSESRLPLVPAPALPLLALALALALALRRRPA